MTRLAGRPEVPAVNALLTKVVLLIDANPETRESRANVMRTLGVTVHCASSARGARSKLESGSYNLVLVDLGADPTAAEELVREIRENAPRQLVRFLVGSPLFLSRSPRGNHPNSSSISQRSPTRTAKSGRNFDFGQKLKETGAEEVA